MSSSSHGSPAKAILYALIANGAIAIAKSVAAFITGSGSMLAEAIHSFADCGNQVLLFIGLKQSARAPDVEHPLGYGKASYFWSFVVAIMLFSLGGLFSIYEGFHKLHSTEPVNHAWIALTVLGVSVLIEIASLLGCLREIRLIRGQRSFSEWLRHTRNAELVVVLGEDLAAIIGLVLAFVFVAAAVITGNPIYDAIGSMAIGVVLVIISVFVATRMKALIVGRSADPDIVAAIQQTIDGDEAIATLFNAITLQLGPTIMLAAKVKLHSGVSMEIAVAQINALERKIKAQFPEIQWCFIEPDIED
jgi:cation diffusion facilitator family transporter